MILEEIQALLTDKFGEDIVLATDTDASPPMLHIPAAKIAEVCMALHTNEKTYFDYLACLTGMDNGPEQGTMEVIYHLYSIPYNFQLSLQIIITRETESQAYAEVPTVSHIWRTADWHEREAYDLVGIHFSGHPDQRRILLPNDWEGHPLRKDYKEQEYYHGIKVIY
ncbi:NADH-quinone oxidoreductase subunit C [Catalinimonas alkaloidigena]|uniref:NADH-quinone oxidoreductase subunit C n=1 Tax=Catalinimonas alkaloidigena TaxID=1075417 RepID=UPI00240635EF|nr:NADH-quinone oxidoreductase subunit C [Catalinimonas alkaloidigena]MDF9799954.1 NADH-quinone oxidoreductase subunit C [Catalinimonas alkaloidigena]